jgi:Domain of unknown function (DUF4160)
MFFNDHNPPHFHVKYGECKAEMDIRTLRILKGRPPPKAQSLVIEWALAPHRLAIVGEEDGLIVPALQGGLRRVPGCSQPVGNE